MQQSYEETNNRFIITKELLELDEIEVNQPDSKILQENKVYQGLINFKQLQEAVLIIDIDLINHKIKEEIKSQQIEKGNVYTFDLDDQTFNENQDRLKILCLGKENSQPVASLLVTFEFAFPRNSQMVNSINPNLIVQYAKIHEVAFDEEFNFDSDKDLIGIFSCKLIFSRKIIAQIGYQCSSKEKSTVRIHDNSQIKNIAL
ncbi:UNKNOWN [Stylonychia lemnae]|uniref:Uncharacterized protein n=1 Tax=Stylonychia lemnae TaxID=5949 RepID=A0A078A692_STYLE|nr:UNKNOWN [Stylonychia lemnae]|eukprot:CDW77724.1 UNKNOWN [Stylonychia lemnae]